MILIYWNGPSILGTHPTVNSIFTSLNQENISLMRRFAACFSFWFLDSQVWPRHSRQSLKLSALLDSAALSGVIGPNSAPVTQGPSSLCTVVPCLALAIPITGATLLHFNVANLKKKKKFPWEALLVSKSKLSSVCTFYSPLCRLCSQKVTAWFSVHRSSSATWRESMSFIHLYIPCAQEHQKMKGL